MHLKSLTWFIDVIRYGVLLLVVLLHIAMMQNITFSVDVPVRGVDGSDRLQHVSGLSPKQYDSLVMTLPLISPARALVRDSRRTYFFNRLPAKTINIIYCYYIYVVVVIVVRIIIFIRRRTREE